MSNYRLNSDVHTETNIPGVGIIEHDFKAGVVTPKDDQEKVALDRLVESGIADVVDAGSKKTSTKVVEPSMTDLPSEE